MSINYAVPPGVYLSEWISETKIHRTVLAEKLGITRNEVNNILNGRSIVTHSIANDLEDITGIPSRTWLLYETKYHSETKRIHSSQQIKQYASRIPSALIQYMRDMGITKATCYDSELLVNDFLRLHNLTTFIAYKDLQKETLNGDTGLKIFQKILKQINPYSLTAWIAVGDEFPVFDNVDHIIFNKEKLKKCLKIFNDYSNYCTLEFVQNAQKRLMNAGVILLIVKSPRKFPLYGITRIINDHIYVIQLVSYEQIGEAFRITLYNAINYILNNS